MNPNRTASLSHYQLPRIDTAVLPLPMEPEMISTSAFSDLTSNNSALELFNPELVPVSSLNRHLWGFYAILLPLKFIP
ncbi:hypothetical protein KEM48_013151 [Puccinia striiformis f. sp. tritici PST-130]|nr:hypothetical protein KEM48_013151 [Puccinia striiformis f. sp. tritici PST-130]